MVAVSSWGRLESAEHHVRWLADRQRLGPALRADLAGLPFGNGRSYGDACLNPGGMLWDCRGLDHFIAFDQDTGVLECEAGVLLRDIQRLAVPRGWMLPVTPGTQLVTVGGAIASDVHGKNHHAWGTFGDHVQGLVLQRTDGTRIECGPDRDVGWFEATLGGVGLTGVIVSARLCLRRVPGPWLDTCTQAFENLGEFQELSRQLEDRWEHTVAWVDCLSGGAGRGLFMCGNPATDQAGAYRPRHSPGVPVVPPVSLVNRVTLASFNGCYYRLGRWRSRQRRSHYEPFFYPLDSIADWNRIYGPAGFYQYQCLLPSPEGREAVAAVLRTIARSGSGSFLAVLKSFAGRSSRGMLGFVRPGITLALDFPNRGGATHRLFRELDAIVAEAGGRLYLAKDARMPRQLFEAGYPRLGEFLPFRDPGISSGMSRRLMGR